MPTFLSLFAGVGGFDLALERAGFRCVGQVEIDKDCQRVLAARWPDVQRYPDIRAWQPRGNGRRGYVESVAREGRSSGGKCQRGAGLLASGREDAEHRVDLLCGGFPCQDYSVAGKRHGLAGDRGALFWQIVRLAKELRPTWGLFENVPGLISSRGGRDFWTVLQGLRECWPAVGYRILDSRYFGVAQRRRRVFFVCGPDEARVASVLFEPEGGGGDSQARGEAGARVAASVAGRAAATIKLRGRGATDEVMDNLVIDGQNAAAVHGVGALSSGEAHHNRGFAVALMDRTRMGAKNLEMQEDAAYALSGENRWGGERQMIAHALSAEGADASEDGTGRGTPLVFDTTQITSDKNYSNPKPGDPCHPLAAGAHAPAVGFAWQSGGDCRLDPKEEEEGTLHANQTPAVMTGMAVRRLTPTECERLQGFPDGWTCTCLPLDEWARDPEGAAERCKCPDSPRYRQMGNAVTVDVVEWLAHRQMDAMTAAPDGGRGRTHD